MLPGPKQCYEVQEGARRLVELYTHTHIHILSQSSFTRCRKGRGDEWSYNVIIHTYGMCVL